MRLLPVIGLALLASCSFAQFSEAGMYPEYRQLSALPGGGFPVTPDGRITTSGALAFSSPIAYSLAGWTFAVGGGLNAKTTSPAFPTLKDDDLWGSTAFGMMGVQLPFGRLTFGGMVLSRKGNNVANGLFTPDTKTGNWSFGIGVQDFKGKGGSAGEGVPGAKDSASSPFVVTTVDLCDGAYISGGIGLRRFGKGFGSVSKQLSDRLTACVEYDSFQFNGGVYYKATNFMVLKHNVDTGVFVGFTGMRYLNASLTFSF
jgi:hypothetical protein